MKIRNETLAQVCFMNDAGVILKRLTKSQRFTCVNQGFWPPLKQKIESYFTAFSLDCFIRRMTQVFLIHIGLTLMVAMVTENGCQYRLK